MHIHVRIATRAALGLRLTSERPRQAKCRGRNGLPNETDRTGLYLSLTQPRREIAASVSPAGPPSELKRVQESCFDPAESVRKICIDRGRTHRRGWANPS